MIVKVAVDTSELERRFRDPDRKIAYATANAINGTLSIGQRAMQLRAEDLFVVRRHEFIRREVAIVKPFASATKGRAFGEIAVGDKQRLLLPGFESGGSRTGFVGHNVAVPVLGGARPSIEAQVPPELRVARLRLHETRGNKRLTRRARGGHVREFTPFGEYGRLRDVQREQGVVWRGLLGSYLIPGLGIFQRLGRGESRALYLFVPSVPIPKELEFVLTIEGVIERNFEDLWRRQVVQALEHRSAA